MRGELDAQDRRLAAAPAGDGSLAAGERKRFAG